MSAGAVANGPILRDIHLPPHPSWWPPAPGWWALALVLLIALAACGVWLVCGWRRRRWRKRIRAHVTRIAAAYAEHGEAVRLAADLSGLLRRASLLIDRSAAAFGGEAWLEFLDRQGRTQAFTLGPGRSLIDAPYRREAQVDAAALLKAVREWLADALPDSAQASDRRSRWRAKSAGGTHD